MIETPKQLVAAYQKYGSLKAIEREEGTGYCKLQRIYAEAVEAGLMDPLPRGAKTREHLKNVALGKVSVRHDGGRKEAKRVQRAALNQDGVTRFIISCAQNGCLVHTEAWQNLKALAKYYDAQILVAPFVYKTNSLAAFGEKKGKDSATASDSDDWYDPAIVPYLQEEDVRLTRSLMFYAKMQILPTAVNPLSGFASYGGRDSGIFPHAKNAMESIPAARGEATKLQYTTNVITKMKYIGKKAGQKAEFHHSFGALLVEVDAEGSWWVRQLLANSSDGTIYDIDSKTENGALRAKRGKVTKGHRIEAFVAGDTHVAQIDPDVRRILYGKGGLVDHLKPRYQFFHDVYDHKSRNHHEITDEFSMYARQVEGRASVESEVREAAAFLLNESARKGCISVVVDSNHDRALERWVRDPRMKNDPQNKRFRTSMEVALLTCIDEGRNAIGLLEGFKLVAGTPPSWLRFLHETESFKICGTHNGIEMGMHGDRGPGGARGSRKGFANMGSRSVIGHSHSAGITDGVYQTGTSSKLDLSYNTGPSSWSHSNCVVFPNGKRQIITIWKGKWHA